MKGPPLPLILHDSDALQLLRCECLQKRQENVRVRRRDVTTRAPGTEKAIGTRGGAHNTARGLREGGGRRVCVSVSVCVCVCVSVSVSVIDVHCVFDETIIFLLLSKRLLFFSEQFLLYL